MRLKRLIAASLCLLLTASASASESVAQFYEKNPIRLVVGFPAGGVYDVTARQVARFLGRHIPGQPTVVVQNMPGAGAMKAAGWLVSQAPKDGSVIAALGAGPIMLPLIGELNAPFDARKLTFFGSVDSGDLYCVTLKGKRAAGRAEGEFIIGGSAPGTVAGDYPWLLRHTLGPRIKVVLGYQGSAELVNAMEREEIDGFCGISLGGLFDQAPTLMRADRFAFPFALSDQPGRRERPEAINLLDSLSASDQDAARLLFAQHYFIRPFAAASEVPPDRLEALQAAFERTLESQEFRDAMGRPEAPLTPVSRAQMMERIEAIYASTAPVRAAARRLIAPVDR